MREYKAAAGTFSRELYRLFEVTADKHVYERDSFSYYPDNDDTTAKSCQVVFHSFSLSLTAEAACLRLESSSAA